jgi:hypothetical protein
MQHGFIIKGFWYLASSLKATGCYLFDNVVLPCYKRVKEPRLLWKKNSYGTGLTPIITVTTVSSVTGQSTESNKYELGPKEEQKEEVVMNTRKDYSDDFKDLVLSMMSYHFYDRPSI